MTLLAGCARDVRTSPQSRPGFDVTLTFQDGVGEGSWTDAQREAVRGAAARWSGHVLGDLEPLWVEKQAGACTRNPAEPAFEGVLDDVHVFVMRARLDGPGGMLARAGPCGTRAEGPSMFGVIRFDTEDLARLEREGVLDVVALHEFGHVLGIGAGPTWWGSHLRPEGDGCLGADAPVFSGPGAVGAWEAAGRLGDVPVETRGGSGMACAHWDGKAAYGELMIAWLSGSMRLTALSLGALEDLGYEVAMDGAASLRAGPRFLGSAPTQPLGHDEVLRTSVTVGSDPFRVRPVRPAHEGGRSSREDGRRRASPATPATGPSLGPCEASSVACRLPSH